MKRAFREHRGGNILPYITSEEHEDAARAKRSAIIGFDGVDFQFVDVDTDGHLQVDILSGGGMGGAAVDDGDAIDTTSQGTLFFGTTDVPGTARAVITDDDGHLQVDVLSQPGGSGGGTEFADGDAIDTDSNGTLLIGTTDVAGTARAVITDDDGHLQVDILNTVLSVDDNGSTLSIDDGGGSITVDGAVTATIQEPLSVDDNGGTLSIDDGGGSITVDGAVTATIQEPLSIDDNGGSITVDGTVGISGVVSVDDNSGSITVDDGGTTLSIDDGGGSITIDGAVTVSSISLDSEYAEDSGHTTGDVGQFILGVVQATQGAMVGADNDYAALQLDGVGRLRTRAQLAFGDTGWTQADDNDGSNVGAYVAPFTYRDTVTTAMNAQTFDNATTSANSTSVSTENRSWVNVHLNIDATNTPTRIQFIPQFSNDGGTTWIDYDFGYYQALLFEDTEVVSGPVHKGYQIEALGDDFRIRVVATGTTASNTFDVTIKLQPQTMR